MPPPVYIQIPKVQPAPADGDNPSFLTTFAPETRNQIYELLCIKVEPIALGPSRWSSRFCKQVGHGKNIVYEHTLAPVVSLLSSCRKIYHEVNGVFYGANELTILPFNRPSHFSQWVGSMDPGLDHFVKLTTSLGIVVSDDKHDVRGFDILPLLRLVWSRPDPQLEVTLGESRYDHTRPWHNPRRNVEIMKFALESIGLQNCSDLRRHVRFSKLLSEVWVSGDATSGSVMFGGTSQERDTTITFNQSEEAEVAIFDFNPRQPSLTALPSAICKSTLAYAIYFPERATTNSTMDEPWSTSLRSLSASRQLRSDAISSLSSNNHSVYTITLPGMHTTTSNLTAIQSWQRPHWTCPKPAYCDEDCCCIQSSRSYHLPPVSALSEHVEFAIKIRVWKTCPTLDDIRIDIISFFYLTGHSSGTAIVSCSLVSADRNVVKGTRNTFRLQNLRMNVSSRFRAY